MELKLLLLTSDQFWQLLAESFSVGINLTYFRTKTMTTKERYVALRVQLPQATSSYRILLENMLGVFEW